MPLNPIVRPGALPGLLASLLLLLGSELDAVTVFFVGGGAGPSSGSDGAVMGFLENRYGAGNVTYLAAGSSSAGDEAGYDVLIISSTVGSSSVRGKFHNSPVPVLNWESVITDNDAGEFGVTTRLNETEIDHTIRILGTHPITAGFTTGQLVQFAGGSSDVFWSVPPESAAVTHLAEDDDTAANKFLSILEQGELRMDGTPAPARRVMFGLKDNTFGAVTADGRTLFGQAVDWAAAGAVDPDPPMVINTAATAIEPTSATIGGSVTDTGGINPLVTLYWGDNDGGTSPGSWDDSVDFGSQGAAFSAGLSDLEPGTTYYFRSFASNGGGEVWAPVTATFTTAPPPDPPTVVNSPATNVTFTTADLNGAVTGTGGETPNVTIYFGENDGGTVAGNWDDAVALGAEAGGFTNSLFGLSHNTTYYFRAFAENSGGQSWAPSAASFTTPAFRVPTLETDPAAGITGTAARVGGRVTSTGGDAPAVTLYWGETDGGTNPVSWDDSVSLGARSSDFATVVSGLSPQTTYYFRAFAQNAAGPAWSSPTRLFTTLDASALVINEFMAANDGGTSNNPNGWWPIANQVPGTTDDWIEILNTGSTSLNLGGWHLTDDAGDPNQWAFPPNTFLAPGEFLLVYASGDGVPDANGNLHTNFSLGANGEYLALVRPDLTLASEFGPGGSDYPSQDDDVSYGLHPNTAASVFFDAPTPGGPNDPWGTARVADTKFSPNRGYYQSALDVTITTATAGATIYYTTDGTPPIDAEGNPTANASLYAGPIPVDRTTPLRAAATLAGLDPSDIDSHTYLLLDIDGANPNGTDAAGLNTPFLEQVQPPGWGNLSSGDFNMDPAISKSTAPSTNHGGLSVAQALLKGLRDIPTISIVMDRDGWSGSSGIYSNSGNSGFAWERECSAEFIPAEGDVRNDWGENCGIRVQGGASRNSGSSPKHSLSFRFRARYGAGKLREDLFPDGPVSEFNVLVLRAGYNNSWIHRDSGQRSRGSMIRDQWARESIFDMGQPDAGRGFMVHVFVNGLYWGVHNLCERQDASHYAAYNGGNEDELDALNGGSPIDGDTSAWNAMKGAVAGGDWSEIQQVVDIDTYIDYQIVHRYGSNADLKTNGNWRAAGGGSDVVGEMAPWKIFSWDGERILESPSATGTPLDPVDIRADLDGLPEYRLRFADRLQKHFFNHGALTPDACKARWMRHASDLDRAIIAESARWGDHRRIPAYTRDAEWLTEQNRLCNSYFPGRSATVFDRYRSQGFYPATDAPVFRVNGSAQHGGEIPGGGTLTITATSGTIYYTLDGSDPRLEGGAVSPNAVAIGSGQGVSLPSSLLVRMRARNGSVWSALDEALFYLEPLATPADLRITELHYHPAPASAVEKAAGLALSTPLLLDNPDLFEFVEVRNLSGQTVNLDGVRFEAGIEFTFGNVALAPGARAVIARNSEAFAIRYPGVPIAGSFRGNLDNDGERVALAVAGGDSIQDFTFNDGGDWPGRADGVGSSLEVVNAVGDDGDPFNWRASSEFHGSPGAAGSGPDGRVVINEVLTHTDAPLLDRIELHNRTGGAVEVSGWVLSDSAAQLRSFSIPEATSIGGGGYLVFDEDDFNAPGANPVTAYAGTVSASPTTVTSSGHGLATGDVVTISGYGGLGAYSGTFEVIVQNPNTFTIDTAYLDNDSTRGTWTRGRPFALDGARGDALWLLETDESGRPVKFVDAVDFDAAFQGEALGRWPNGAGTGTLVTMTANTFGMMNAGPQVGPVLISEVMYQPGSPLALDQYEFVEICNAGGVTENLDRWRLRGGADFDFTAAHSLQAGESLVVVSFDPAANPGAADAFRLGYGIASNVPLVGPFTDGPLRNDTGALRLQRPDLPPPGDPEFYPAVTEDEVIYSSMAPWPSEAAGGGSSLQRTAVAGFGNFATSWNAAGPNPGGKPLDYETWREAFFGPGQPAGSAPLEDFNGDGITNLVAYGLSMSPLVYQPELLPLVQGAGGDLTMTYTRDTQRSGITWQVEASSNLIDWTDVPDSMVDRSGSLETREARIAIGPGERIFLRLAITN